MKIWVPVVKIKTVELGRSKGHAAAYSLIPEQSTHHKKKHRTKLWATIAIIILVPVVILWMVVKNLNAPAEGTVNDKPPAKADVVDPYANPGQINGKYISFTFPAHYKQVPQALTGSFVQVNDFYTTIQNGRQISVGVMPGSLTENSGISLRKSQPDKYVTNPRTQYGQSFTSTDGTEMDDFIEHNGMVASVGVISQNPADLTDDYNTVVSSLHWK